MTSDDTLQQVARLVRHASDQKITGTVEIRVSMSQGGISGLSVDIVDKKVSSFRYGNAPEK